MGYTIFRQTHTNSDCLRWFIRWIKMIEGDLKQRPGLNQVEMKYWHEPLTPSKTHKILEQTSLISGNGWLCRRPQGFCCCPRYFPTQQYFHRENNGKARLHLQEHPVCKKHPVIVALTIAITCNVRTTLPEYLNGWAPSPFLPRNTQHGRDPGTSGFHPLQRAPWVPNTSCPAASRRTSVPPGCCANNLAPRWFAELQI